MDTSLAKLKEQLLASKAKQWILRAEVLNNEAIIYAKAGDVVDLLSFLKTDKRFQFHMLMSISGVDYPQRELRFDVVYNLLSLTRNTRLRLSIQASDKTFVPSVTGIFDSACWYEREVWDLYGVMFKNNPDLRRILTDYGFEGHPLRKDFPLSGHTEVRYDITKKEVLYEKVNLTQEFRNFDFTSPWEGGSYVLPGDEKASK